MNKIERVIQENNQRIIDYIKEFTINNIHKEIINLNLQINSGMVDLNKQIDSTPVNIFNPNQCCNYIDKTHKHDCYYYTERQEQSAHIPMCRYSSHGHEKFNCTNCEYYINVPQVDKIIKEWSAIHETYRSD